uniref:Copper transporter n=1 Tax=Meloidogyne hapla TaxID=6305 RepID=A0A1I8C0C6_MELHA
MCQPQNPSISSSPTNSTGFGFANSIQTWHLNSAAFTVVATFIFVQFRALLRSILTQNAQRMVRASISSLRGKISEGSDRRKSSNKKVDDNEEKEYMDKGVKNYSETFSLNSSLRSHEKIMITVE